MKNCKKTKEVVIAGPSSAWDAMHRIKVVSDGTINGTYVCDAATGQKLDMVSNVKIEIDASLGVPKAILEVLYPVVEVTVPKELMTIKVARPNMSGGVR